MSGLGILMQLNQDVITRGAHYLWCQLIILHQSNILNIQCQNKQLMHLT